MYKFITLVCLAIFFSNCKHESVEQQTVDALRGKWEIYEIRSIDPQTKDVLIRQNDHMSMYLLSPWYGGDSGVNFINAIEVIGKFGTDWTRFDETSYTLTQPNKISFKLKWANNYENSAEILKLDATELWLKRGNSFPQVVNELRLKRVQ